MKDILQWIPNFFKGLHELLKDVKKEAGGGWLGQVVYFIGLLMFLILFVAFVAWASKPAFDNLAGFLSYFNINIKPVSVTLPSSFFINIVFALLMTVVMFVVLVGASAVVGAFLGMLMNMVLSPFTTRRIDKMFAELLPLLGKNHAANPSAESKQLLDDAKRLCDRWNTSRINRLARLWTSKKTKAKIDATKL